MGAALLYFLPYWEVGVASVDHGPPPSSPPASIIILQTQGAGFFSPISFHSLFVAQIHFLFKREKMLILAVLHL